MDKLTIQEFGATIKQKYPQYSALSDYDIGQKTLAKYPQYGEKIIHTFNVPDVQPQRPNLQKLQQEATIAQKEAKKANSVGGFLGNFGKSFVENIAPSEVGLGKTIGKVVGNQTDTYSKLIGDVNTQQANLIKAIREKEAKGGDTTSLKRIYNDNVNQLRELNKNLAEESNLPSTGKVIGQLGGTALDVLTAGTYSKAKTGLMTTGKLAKKSGAKLTEKLATATGLPELGKIATQQAGGLFTRQGAKNIATGAGIGYASDVTMGLQGLRGEDRTGGSAFIPGLGTAIGTTIPLASEINQTRKNIYNPTPDRVNKAVNELENRYTEWSTGTKPGKKLVNQFNKKTEMLNKAGTEGKTPMRTLAENGIVPELKGVKFNTFDQANDFRNSTNVLRETNRDALVEAGFSTVPTDIPVLERKALEVAKTPQNVNAGRYDKMASDIRKEFQLLRKNYPDGKIPLILQDDIKSARWDNVFKNKGLVEADMLKKDSEYAIAKAFQKNIEEVAEQAGHTELAQLNREIGDKLDASKFLESLDGKVLKGGRVGKYVGTLIGSSLGQSIPGKIVGALGGNYVADKLIKASVTSPVRRAILSKLAKEDPEAYTMTLKWLAEQDKLRATRLALPAGGTQPIVNEGRPIKVFPKNVEGEYVGKDIVGQSKSPTAQQTIPAITKVNKTGISNTIQNIKNKVNDIPNKQGGFATGIGYKETGDLTTKILKDLEGKTTVSKQYILDATNRGELKQVERDITRNVLDTMKGDTINVKEFTDKVKSELLPLKVKSTSNPKTSDYWENKQLISTDGTDKGTRMQPRYENISLPSEVRGNVKNYKENIYESPISTSAGQNHFSGSSNNYFGHTRIEDMADNKTRRVIEVQSDLYQKGNLEREGVRMLSITDDQLKSALSPKEYTELKGLKDKYSSSNPVDVNLALERRQIELFEKAKANLPRTKEVAKLQQYNDPTAHFRMIREEIKKASQDGKTKLQFPTGETAMKIEGLGDENAWQINNWNDRTGRMETTDLTPDKLRVGQEVDQQYGDNWVITEVLGDGKFKAVPKWNYDEGMKIVDSGQKTLQEFKDNISRITETFDISGKVDTNNPIYKFYEKDVQKYLNKFGGKRVVDDKGVSWIEIPITKEQGKMPVEAFGKIQAGVIGTGAIISGAGVLGASYLKSKKDKK